MGSLPSAKLQGLNLVNLSKRQLKGYLITVHKCIHGKQKVFETVLQSVNKGTVITNG